MMMKVNNLRKEKPQKVKLNTNQDEKPKVELLLPDEQQFLLNENNEADFNSTSSDNNDKMTNPSMPLNFSKN